MNNFFKQTTKDRKWYINAIICFLVLISSVVLPTMFQLLFRVFISNTNICYALAYVCTISVLVLIYYKDLINEFKIFKNNFRSCFNTGFKYYIVGLMAMMFFNLVISNILGDVSSNESQVRDLLFDSPLFMMVCISIFAPIEEELIFRKSLQPLFKNKYVYSILCGLFFGLAHLTTNFMDGSFVISDLLYLLPYGSLGFVFASMDFETKSTFTSMMIHSLHNTCTGLLLLLLSFSGVL